MTGDQTYRINEDDQLLPELKDFDIMQDWAKPRGI